MISPIKIQYLGQDYSFNPSEPIDISMILNEDSANCYYADKVGFETYEMGDFIGSVARGGVVNYQKITLTPHGNGTHTECYGHLSADNSANIYNCLKEYMFVCHLVTLPVHQQGEDQLVTLQDLKNNMLQQMPEAVIIRTTPNTPDKLTRQYSGSNPPYLEASIGKFLADHKVKHLLVDLPSVDREVDGGKLLCHRAFWQHPEKTRKDSTITELVYVNSTVPDGLYLLNLQVISLWSDASPSKPIIYPLSKI
ncbi:N-formylkynurenine (aryl-) formamidase [Microscilla marina ATCC 23134]|uniref:N-formylkynurenine (Aryl-) formamidase n=2 Tax=Microscilla marina TaxID=1027 RepID=A1ZTV1_MICM2|nr:N-formylkynurenine (aryl-) formamidase [Microscilla marina ATCC 23134]